MGFDCRNPRTLLALREKGKRRRFAVSTAFFNRAAYTIGVIQTKPPRNVHNTQIKKIKSANIIEIIEN
nr:MAG TPA: hypothetical protein [Caudoviricetes sp.]